MDLLEPIFTGVSNHEKSQWDALRTAPPTCIPEKARWNFSCPFKQSENLANIKGLTVLLPIELPIKPVNNTFIIWLDDNWRPFLEDFSELISKKFNRSYKDPLDLKIFYHVIVKGYGSDDEHVLAFLADPKKQTPIVSFYSFYSLDITTRQVDVLGPDGWKTLANFTDRVKK